MKRRRRTEILIKGSVETSKKLAEEIINNYDIKTIEKPNSGLVMIKIRETAKKNLFYLGEVLVTEAKVQIEEHMGMGIVQDNKPELAYYLAVIDAAYNADLEETKLWTNILLEEEKRISEKKNKHQAQVLKTKVNFETMDV
ncbi:phosphonate C-P lyase system protein PhnG [Maledivibacter halophilus]|uniref:Alpha-D-ribose 1-methylphosphonate 5-triphosphate synthase subunit PhnG n=1 Tax=Maledivibacter halophilus TaxID=36842 RepID=A0A1T5J8P7_9FIRM|nr:phosphonate C-P lyase system protein PhnG [Maledivibacter halophilus]SKC47714.1 alpha-D-ribose 1-methylphosphonate 5-triphosphate synthase subunit PhnG [Maledivibacter halophilus]